MGKINYSALESIGKNYVELKSVADVLQWDSAVLMPEGGKEYRAKQIATVESAVKNLLETEYVAKLIQDCKDEDLNEFETKNYRYIKKLYQDTKLIPNKLQQDLDFSIAECEIAWRHAKEDNNFASWRPYLNKVLTLTREVANRRADFYSIEPYDTLLSIYDPSNTQKRITPIFEEVEKFIGNNINSAIGKQRTISDFSSLEAIPANIKDKIIDEIAHNLGFDFSAGRIDKSSHPFCRGITKDVRITMRQRPSTYLSNIMAIIHEAGHAIYLQNIDKDLAYQAIGAYRNMTIHESQSLLYEFQLGSSPQFIEMISSIINKHANLELKSYEIDAFINQVSRGFIRTDADEFSYPLHIIHRYNLEKLLISGDLQVADLPDAWNQEFKRLFGIIPTSEVEGCLQDIHWSMGYFGYFPCYLLGAILASQIMTEARTHLNMTNVKLTIEHLKQLKNWLNNTIHKFGGYYDSNELAQRLYKEDINAKNFISYLQNKFLIGKE